MSISKKCLAMILAILLILIQTGCMKNEGQGTLSTKAPSAGTSAPQDEDGKVTDGGTVNLSVGPYDTLNPLITSNEDIRVYMGLVYEKLVEIDELMMPQPALFESWISDESFTVWEFTLAKNIKMHNGDTVGASDVKALFDYIREKGGNYAENAENIAGCFVKDQLTVQFVLASPDSLMPCKMSIPLLCSETLKGDSADKAPVGAGMYRFVSKADGVITLERYGEYYNAERKPRIQTVKIREFESEYKKYGSDFDFAIFYGSRHASYIFDESTKVIDYTGKTYNYVVINCNATYTIEQKDERDNKTVIYTDIPNALTNKNVRKALNLMVDRTVLCNAAAAGSGIVSLLPAYNGTAYRSAVQDTYEYDIEAAYKLLTDEGYRRNEEDGYWYYYDGTALIIDAIVPASSFELCTVMRNVKSAMEKLGITVELQELTDEDFAVKYQKKQYMIMPMQVELGSWIDLEKIFETGGELNCSFYSNASVDSYFKQIKSLGASDVIAAGYGEIEKILLDENPIIGLYINNDSIVVRDSVKGIARGTVYAWNPLANFYKWGITEENT